MAPELRGQYFAPRPIHRVSRWAVLTALLVVAGAPNVAHAVDVDAILSKMSIEQKVAQMHLVGVQGHEVTDELAKEIATNGVGGVWLKPGENFNFPEELAALVGELQKAAQKGKPAVPLFVALDQEGGVFSAVNAMIGGASTPGNLALGADGREEDTAAAYRLLAQDLRACGVNVDFAPMLDLLGSSKNADLGFRSFGTSAKLIGTLARGAVSATQDEGILSCVKYFPGIDIYDEDPQTKPVHISMDNARIWEDDLAPFRSAIASSCGMVMTSHVFIDAWDPAYMVTVSQKAISGVLRGQLGFKGLIVTDSMDKSVITGGELTKPTGTVLAVEAGCDLIWQDSADLPELASREKAVLEAIRTGRFTQERINASVRLILQAKAAYGILDGGLPDVNRARHGWRKPGAGWPEMLTAAERGVKVLRDKPGLLPLAKSDKKIMVVCPPSITSRAGKPGQELLIGHTLGQYVREQVPTAVEVRIDTVPTDAEIAYALKHLTEADVIIAGVLLAEQSPRQVVFMRRVLALKKPTIVVGMGLPADAELLPEAETFVAANGPAPVNSAAAVRAIFSGKPEVPVVKKRAGRN